MKVYKLIKSGILPEGSISLNGCKRPVEKIVSEILGYKLLYLDGENKYIRLSTHYQKITDDDLRMLIRELTTYDYYLNSSVGAENAESIRILIGYALSSITDVKKAVIIVSAPHSGKSKILDVIERAVGTEYVRMNLCGAVFSFCLEERAVIWYNGSSAYNAYRKIQINEGDEHEWSGS